VISMVRGRTSDPAERHRPSAQWYPCAFGLRSLPVEAGVEGPTGRRHRAGGCAPVQPCRPGHHDVRRECTCGLHVASRPAQLEARPPGSSPLGLPSSPLLPVGPGAGRGGAGRGGAAWPGLPPLSWRGGAACHQQAARACTPPRPPAPARRRGCATVTSGWGAGCQWRPAQWGHRSASGQHWPGHSPMRPFHWQLEDASL
jgi:hypothetical protein